MNFLFVLQFFFFTQDKKYVFNSIWRFKCIYEISWDSPLKVWQLVCCGGGGGGHLPFLPRKWE